MRQRFALNNVPRPRSPRAWLVLAVVAAVLGGSGTAVALAARDRLPEGAVMRVGDRTVGVDELDARITSLSALYGVVVPDDPERADTFRRDAAKSMALSLLLEQEADRRGIVIAEKQARAQLSEVVSERLGGDRKKFVAYLGAAGISEAQVLEEIRRTIATSRLFAEVTRDVPAATRADAKAEYDARRSEMTTPERRALANIVVESQADAEAALADLRGGAGFAAVARRVSLDRATRDSGGDLGTRAASELEAAYADAAFAAREGAVFGPVETTHGWNVGRVVGVVPGTPLSFAEVEATLVEAITSREQLAAWRSWIGDLLREAEVEYDEAFAPADPTSPPSGGDPTPTQGEEQP